MTSKFSNEKASVQQAKLNTGIHLSVCVGVWTRKHSKSQRMITWGATFKEKKKTEFLHEKFMCWKPVNNFSLTGWILALSPQMWWFNIKCSELIWMSEMQLVLLEQKDWYSLFAFLLASVGFTAEAQGDGCCQPIPWMTPDRGFPGSTQVAHGCRALWGCLGSLVPVLESAIPSCARQPSRFFPWPFSLQ